MTIPFSTLGVFPHALIVCAVIWLSFHISPIAQCVGDKVDAIWLNQNNKILDCYFPRVAFDCARRKYRKSLIEARRKILWITKKKWLKNPIICTFGYIEYLRFLWALFASRFSLNTKGRERRGKIERKWESKKEETTRRKEFKKTREMLTEIAKFARFSAVLQFSLAWN